MTTLDHLDDYEIIVGEPYLTKDLAGKYVVLQDEILRSDPDNLGVQLTYHNEILIDDNPSDEVIFKMKLKGAVRETVFKLDRE